jgi:hypothetical protein
MNVFPSKPVPSYSRNARILRSKRRFLLPRFLGNLALLALFISGLGH